jgi:hypothetical protein
MQLLSETDPCDKLQRKFGIYLLMLAISKGYTQSLTQPITGLLTLQREPTYGNVPGMKCERWGPNDRDFSATTTKKNFRRQREKSSLPGRCFIYSYR